ncbi:hypothetical protein KIPB_017069, partial [Kipferlia bialata]
WIGGVAFDGTGRHMATCSGDKTVKIWDLLSVVSQGGASATPSYHDLCEHTSHVWSVKWHPEAPFLLSGS